MNLQYLIPSTPLLLALFWVDFVNLRIDPSSSTYMDGALSFRSWIEDHYPSSPNEDHALELRICLMQEAANEVPASAVDPSLLLGCISELQQNGIPVEHPQWQVQMTTSVIFFLMIVAHMLPWLFRREVNRVLLRQRPPNHTK